jgi:hypothetical protein
MCPALRARVWQFATAMRPWTDMDTVKYSAFMRKQTRYNPTRGGAYFYLPHSIQIETRHSWALLTLNRTLPLPRPLQDVLANRPRHDSPQDRPR